MKPYVPTNTCLGYTFFPTQDSASVTKLTQSVIFFFTFTMLSFTPLLFVNVIFNTYWRCNETETERKRKHLN